MLHTVAAQGYIRGGRDAWSKGTRIRALVGKQ
jgi:hypothetical protein